MNESNSQTDNELNLKEVCVGVTDVYYLLWTQRMTKLGILKRKEQNNRRTMEVRVRTYLYSCHKDWSRRFASYGVVLYVFHPEWRHFKVLDRGVQDRRRRRRVREFV